MNGRIRLVDPVGLWLPGSRTSGADPWKLHRQIRSYGSATAGMPPLFVVEDKDGELEILDGVTRATRIAKLRPGALVPVVVIGYIRKVPPKALRIGDVA